MVLSYKSQNDSVKALRAWAKNKGYVMRKCNMMLGGSEVHKLYDKVNYKAISGYFTLYDVTQINNYCSDGFDYLIV